MTVVVDASVLVAALVDTGREGQWAEELLAASDLASPHLAPVETLNVLRRLEAAGTITPPQAAEALDLFAALDLELYPLAPVADRVWRLRGQLTSYDAWYVALAESLQVPLATLNRRLARAPNVACELSLPPFPSSR